MAWTDLCCLNGMDGSNVTVDSCLTREIFLRYRLSTVQHWEDRDCTFRECGMWSTSSASSSQRRLLAVTSCPGPSNHQGSRNSLSFTSRFFIPAANYPVAMIVRPDAARHKYDVFQTLKADVSRVLYRFFALRSLPATCLLIVSRSGCVSRTGPPTAVVRQGTSESGRDKL